MRCRRACCCVTASQHVCSCVLRLARTHTRPTHAPVRPRTHTQLEEIKAARGLTVDDGTLAADKPLAEILADKKKAKQDAFDDMWKQMKTGEARSTVAGRCSAVQWKRLR